MGRGRPKALDDRNGLRQCRRFPHTDPGRPASLGQTAELLHMFRKAGVEEKINLQCDGSKAKVYQVRQVRAVLLKYRLGGEQ